MQPCIILTGRCRTCGRLVPGRVKRDHIMQGECPRCGTRPFLMEGIGPYAGNVALLTDTEALDYIAGCEHQAEVETTFRLEMLRVSGPRDEILLSGIERMIVLDDNPGLCRKQVWREGITLGSLKTAWLNEMKDPSTMRYYQNLALTKPQRKELV